MTQLTYADGEMERVALAYANSELRSIVLQQEQEIRALKEALQAREEVG